MLSRVAESLFWMSRYLERAEDVARIIAVNFQATLDAPEVSQALAWEPVIAITGDRQVYKAAFEKYAASPLTESVSLILFHRYFSKTFIQLCWAQQYVLKSVANRLGTQRLCAHCRVGFQCTDNRVH